MRTFAAAISASAGLFFLAIAVFGVLEVINEPPAILGRMFAGAVMAVVGITSIRVAGYLLRQGGEGAIEATPQDEI